MINLTRTIMTVLFSDLFASLVVVCPADIAAPSEWFLCTPSSGVRGFGPAATRLCTWLDSKLRALLRSTAHATTLLKLPNIAAHSDEFCVDTALYIPGVTTRNLPAQAQSDVDSYDSHKHLYRSRVLSGDCPSITPSEFLPLAPFGRDQQEHSPDGLAPLPVSPPLPEAALDLTVVTCTRSSHSTLHILCTTKDEGLEYLEYRGKILKLDFLAPETSTERGIDTG